MGATPKYNRVYKRILAQRKQINCSHCAFNRGENAKRRGTDDRGKNPRRRDREGSHACRTLGWCRRCNPEKFRR